MGAQCDTTATGLGTHTRCGPGDAWYGHTHAHTHTHSERRSRRWAVLSWESRQPSFGKAAEDLQRRIGEGSGEEEERDESGQRSGGLSNMRNDCVDKWPQGSEAGRALYINHHREPIELKGIRVRIAAGPGSSSPPPDALLRFFENPHVTSLRIHVNQHWVWLGAHIGCQPGNAIPLLWVNAWPLVEHQWRSWKLGTNGRFPDSWVHSRLTKEMKGYC